MDNYHGAKLDIKKMEVYPQTLKKGKWEQHILKDSAGKIKKWKLGIKFQDKPKAETIFSDLSKKFKNIKENLVKIDNDGVIHLIGDNIVRYIYIKDLLTYYGGKAVYGDQEPKKEDLEYYYNNVSNCMPNESKKKLSFKEHYLNEMPWVKGDDKHLDFKMELPNWPDRFVEIMTNNKNKDRILKHFYDIDLYRVFFTKRFEKLNDQEKKKVLSVLPNKFIKDMRLE